MIHPDSAPSGSPDASRLAVVIVLYNSADAIERCLATLPGEVELILVDNASSDDGAERALAARPIARLIRSERNRGFGGGCNLGWQAAGAPFVAFVNPDVRLRPGALERLLERVASAPHSMVGPAMLEPSGAVRPVKRAPSAWHDALGLLPAAQRWAPAGVDGKLALGDPVHERGGPVGSLEGACFVIARADLEAVGGFDEDLFLYYEEDSLAVRLAAFGGRLLYEPGAAAEHEGEASTRQVRPLAVHHFHRSRALFYRKRDGELRGRLATLLLMMAAALSLPAAGVNAVLGRRRQRTPRELALILGGLSAGLLAPTHARVRYRQR